MERWYIGFSTYGTPQAILERLISSVRKYGLGNFVVRFCYEKGAGNKQRRQFYIFVGVESEQFGVIPEEYHTNFYNVLQLLHLSDENIYVNYDEVVKMVSKELEIHNLRQVKSFRLPEFKPSDPYSYSPYEVDEATIETNQAFNQLLYWLSAYGRGTWQQFKAACLELGLDSNGEYSRRILRRLRSLGHVETTRDGQQWFIAPPCLVEQASQSNRYHAFLTGQRSPTLLEELEQFAELVEYAPHPYGNAPELVKAIFTDPLNAEAFVQFFSHKHHQLYLVGQAGLTIAATLPSLDLWEKGLPALDIIRANYDFQQLIDSTFYPIELPQATGLYRVKHTSERFDHPEMTLFYNAETGVWRKADWYGLRYLALRRTGQQCDFHYDTRLKTLSIPQAARPPDIYERALVLASGRLPLFRHDQVIFGDISEELAHILANKLEAGFIEYRGL